MADDNVRELQKRCVRLFEKKSRVDALNQEIARQFYPERANFTGEMLEGAETATHLFDSTPVLARRDLCNSIGAILRPRSQQWFKAAVDDEEAMERQRVQASCDAITKIMRSEMYRHGAQFGRATKEADHDYGTFGNAALFVGENRLRDGLVFRSYHLRDCAWVEGPDGDIAQGGAFWRKYKQSARNIRAEFPDAELHKDILNALDDHKDPDREFTLAHCMMPADEYYSGERRADYKKPWVSVYYDHDHCMILRKNDEALFKYVIPRWMLIGSQYAVSPAALTCLPDARGLQTMARVLLEAGEKAVDPPMKAFNEAIVGGINLFSGGVTWIENEYDEKTGKAVEPILLGKQVGLGVDLMMLAKQSIKDCWFLTKLSLPPPESGRTATEVLQLTEEYVRANIPLFEPIETTYNAPMLSLIAETLDYMGAFDHVIGQKDRRELMGDNVELEFEFANPLQDAIERNKANQAQVVLGLVAGLAEIAPEAARVNDWAYIQRDVTRGTGAPAKWLLDPEVEEAKHQQAQQMGDVLGGLDMAQRAAGVVDTGASAAAQLTNAGLVSALPAEVGAGGPI